MMHPRRAQSQPASEEHFHSAQGPAYRVDLAGAIDQPHEILAEELGLSRAGALRVIEWHEREMERTITRRVTELLCKVVAELIQPQKNLAVVIWGLAFSCGLAAARNGAKSMAVEADRLRLHRASLSFWKRRWDKVLGHSGSNYGKTPETCAKLSVARRRVLAQGPRPTAT